MEFDFPKERLFVWKDGHTTFCCQADNIDDAKKKGLTSAAMYEERGIFTAARLLRLLMTQEVFMVAPNAISWGSFQ